MAVPEDRGTMATIREEGVPAFEADVQAAFTAVQARASVDNAIRTLQQTLVQFSAMADAKANMMLTVCSIVLTISVTQLNSPLLRWPFAGLTVLTMVALLLAILAVLPAGTGAGRTPAPDSPSFNPLFFGHFATLARDEFGTRMAEVMSGDPQLYEALVYDIYGQGVVLARKKYRLLRLSYLSFLTGVVLAVIGAIGTILPR
jgi:hypothetical protein